jgi:hypothetical protein
MSRNKDVRVSLFLLSLLFHRPTYAQTPQIKASTTSDPPKVYTIAALPDPPDGRKPPAPCTQPKVNRYLSWENELFHRNKTSNSNTVTNGSQNFLDIGYVDMRTESNCLPTQAQVTVPNGQNVRISLATDPSNVCGGVPTYKADPKPDYGSVFASFLPKVLPLYAPEVKKLGAPPNTWHQTILLPSVRDGTLTVVISCMSAAKALKPDEVKPADIHMPRTVTVHYTNVPQFSGSAGVLISTLGTKVYGTKTSQTGVSSTTGVVTTEITVSVTDSSNVQFVPIAFLNTYLVGSTRMHIDFQAGAGINPNGSKTKVEYFLGPAFSTHGIYISPGVHIAQTPYLMNGFSLNEVVASGVTVPVGYYTTFRFGISISYSPSIPSSSSAK